MTADSDEDLSDRELDEEPGSFRTRVISGMMEIFVVPELARRGMKVDPDTVDRYLVELPANGDAHTVRLGDQAHLDVILEKEDGVTYFAGVRPQSTAVSGNSGWVCFLRIPGVEGQALAFDFRRNLMTARRLVTKAESFLRSAENSGEDLLSPALDSLFSAAELTVQALMLIQATADPDHKVRRDWLRRWTEAGNGAPTHHDVLCNLANLRKDARYGPDDPRLKPDRFRKILATVREMLEEARAHTSDTGRPMMATLAASTLTPTPPPVE
ncbi:HEPN domain-containing protein [Nocardia asteroides]|uniref:HEPN domain-containing protein n=1 Tax=Nocardia asteroides TaxID=1824 RepID=UPI00343315A9